MARNSFSKIAPLDPSSIFLVWLGAGPSYWGARSPEFLSSAHLKSVAIGCAILVFVACFLPIWAVCSLPESNAEVVASHEARGRRRAMGYPLYLVRLFALCFVCQALPALGFLVAFKVTDARVSAFVPLLLMTLVTSGITTAGLFLQSLVVDIFLRRRKAR